ncbi:MAG: DUF1249 domain-containing protein [Thioalkalispiraceae bacterium]|jgi:uncharacterized protein YqiB (DUF1249 family)
MSHSIDNTRSRTPMWVYERNFSYLKAVVEACLADTEGQYLHHYETGHFEFSIAERCKYTLEMDIRQVIDINEFLGNGVSFRVRIYMDARLAEVVSYLGQARLLPEYEYPNKNMWQPDEKKQANLLLHDCLLHISQQGLQEQCIKC